MDRDTGWRRIPSYLRSANIGQRRELPTEFGRLRTHPLYRFCAVDGLRLNPLKNLAPASGEPARSAAPTLPLAASDAPAHPLSRSISTAPIRHPWPHSPPFARRGGRRVMLCEVPGGGELWVRTTVGCRLRHRPVTAPRRRAASAEPGLTPRCD